ncbi:MAG: hypothetical protein OEY11_04625 [Gammaproteobacteria bacterium]|nr:hypothetical protein [Gammaproteobacteria bacterium]
MTKIIIAAVFFVLLSACADDANNPSVNNISLATVSGSSAILNGVYQSACYFDANFNNYSTVTITVSGSSADFYKTLHSAADCSLSSRIFEGNITGNVVAEPVIAIDGWVTSAGTATAAPAASDGSGALSGVETVTPVTSTVTQVSQSYTNFNPALVAGVTHRFFFVIDDTGPAIKLYSDYDYHGYFVANGSLSAVSDYAIIEQ